MGLRQEPNRAAAATAATLGDNGTLARHVNVEYQDIPIVV